MRAFEFTCVCTSGKRRRDHLLFHPLCEDTVSGSYESGYTDDRQTDTPVRWYHEEWRDVAYTDHLCSRDPGGTADPDKTV